jgi:hypothetical protein
MAILVLIINYSCFTELQHQKSTWHILLHIWYCDYLLSCRTHPSSLKSFSDGSMYSTFEGMDPNSNL